jgi:activator of HSP90 ATPase
MPRNLITAATLPATPERLYDMYVDAKLHSAFTGSPVTIEARAGAPFRAFDGALTGTILHVEPKKMVVQAWRSMNFPADAIDSILILTFWPQGKEARIELNHINVPESDFAGISHGWEKFYWTPWRAYLLANP